MQPTQDPNFNKLFSEIIHQQMMILGPDITYHTVKSVPGINFDQNGDVVNLTGEPKVLLEQLVHAFVELSGLIVEKTIDGIINTYPGMGLNNNLEVGSNDASPSVLPVPQAPILASEAKITEIPKVQVQNGEVNLDQAIDKLGN